MQGISSGENYGMENAIIAEAFNGGWLSQHWLEKEKFIETAEKYSQIFLVSNLGNNFERAIIPQLLKWLGNTNSITHGIFSLPYRSKRGEPEAVRQVNKTIEKIKQYAAELIITRVPSDLLHAGGYFERKHEILFRGFKEISYFC